MTVIVPEAAVLGQEKTRNQAAEEEFELVLNGGFSTAESNAFGASFRNYENKQSERHDLVQTTYRLKHINQTYEYALKKMEEYSRLDKAVMSIWEACELLNEIVDESDPDLDEPQIQHLLQSAEAIRKDYPHHDWLHLTALIHDLGKVMLHPSFGQEPQWAVVGDIYPLGCAFDPSVVHYEHFVDNPDFHNPKYNTKYGIYRENCGLENVVMTWGHDEYMCTVAKLNNTTLPAAALGIIRFHSFYALHKTGAYTHLMNEQDKETLKWIQIFSKYDLYSKSKVRIDVEAVKPYYLSLIEKYFPSKLRW